jgi:MFS family permease
LATPLQTKVQPAPQTDCETPPAVTASQPFLKRTLAAFAYRDFRVLWFGAFTSTVGTWMQKVAQSWLVLDLTKSSFFLGLDDFLGQLPILLFTLAGGVIADRHDRRRLLLGSQYVQMTAAFILAALVFWGHVRIWHILGLSFLTGCAQAFGGPGYRNNGLAAYLVNALTVEILNRDIVPCYGTTSSNIASQKEAHRAGFTPAWMCDHRVRFERELSNS